MSKIVLALGGNALGNTPREQLELVKQTARPIADLVENGHTVVIAHGNGPQVGMINLAFASAAAAGAVKSDMPFPECGAMSQGYIGYHLQNSLRNELSARGIERSVVTLVTQVVVDEADPAFGHPTKPIGAFYRQEEARAIMAAEGCVMVEDAGRGWRRVVPSPLPVDIAEKDAILALMEAGTVVIAAGGGGIPVVRRDGRLEGVSAVIDKDFASAKLAETVGADLLVILTAVDAVAINYGRPEQRSLSSMTLAEAERYCAEGQFAPGSMLPKVRAAMGFARSGGRAVIAGLANAAAAIRGESGTVVTP